MKTITKIAEKLGLKVQRITFRHAGNGSKCIGYSLYSEDKTIHTGYGLIMGSETLPEVIEFEPVWRMSGKTWLVSDYRKDRPSFGEIKPSQFKQLL